jgi:hypothetical protein
MAELKGVQINPKIKEATRARLKAFCDEQGCSLGDAVEAALAKYLAEDDTDLQGLMFQKLNSVQEGMAAMIGLLEKLVGLVEKQAKPRELPIANYDKLYQGAIRPAETAIPASETPMVVGEEEQSSDVPAAAPAQKGWWGRRFAQRVTS